METLFRLNGTKPVPAAGVKVLKQADCETLATASGIIEEAKKAAEVIQRQAEGVYKARWEAGYKDGIEAGKMEHTEKMMETVLASVEFIENIENTVVSVVNQSVRKIIGDLDDETRVRRIVSTALNTVRGQQKVTVRVSPVDEPTVSKAMAAMTSGSYLTIIADPHLAKDSCILESELGVVDASLETQLKALQNAFNAKLRR